MASESPAPSSAERRCVFRNSAHTLLGDDLSRGPCKAAAVDGRRELMAGGWTTFQIIVENAAGITAPLVIESGQLMHSDSDKDRDHWLRLTIEPSGQITSETKEVRTLHL